MFAPLGPTAGVGGHMWRSFFCTCFLSLIAVTQTEVFAQRQPALTGQDLLLEYNRIVALSRSGPYPRWPSGLPKKLGTFQGRSVESVFLCGDLCPNRGFVEILFTDVKEPDCAAIGTAVYTDFWVLQYAGCSPLVNVHGKIVDKGRSWFLSDSNPNPPAETHKSNQADIELLFDTASNCRQLGLKIECSNLRNGQAVSIRATRAADTLAVIEVDVLRDPADPR